MTQAKYTATTSRYPELDSLRGLAALTVYLSHLFGTFAFTECAQSPSAIFRGSLNEFTIVVLKYSPIHIIWGGHEAVIFFFFLSGFVLSIPWNSNQSILYLPFSIKRAFRLYIPYIVCIIVSLVLRHLTAHPIPTVFSNFFHFTWHDAIKPSTIIQFSSLIGYFETHSINPIVWSLVHEMRISLVFPLIMSLINHFSWRHRIAISFSFSVFAAACMLYFHPLYDTNIFLTIHYAAFFILGATLARNKDSVVYYIATMHPYKRVAVWTAAILFYTYAWWFLPNYKPLHYSFINDWFTTIGVSIIIAFSISNGKFAQFLCSSWVRYFGRISYSLYLYHIVITFSLIYAFYDILPAFLILLLAIPLTIITSEISYRFIESPSIALGRKLSELVLARKRPV